MQSTLHLSGAVQLCAVLLMTQADSVCACSMSGACHEMLIECHATPGCRDRSSQGSLQTLEDLLACQSSRLVMQMPWLCTSHP